MFSSFKQSVTIALLFVLAWSCFGLGFGMIGHGLMQMDGMGSEDMAAMQECCVTNAEDLGSSHTASMDHITAIALFSPFDLLAFILLLPFVYVVAKVVISLYTRWRLYARQWLERWSYFSLYLNRLFSRGILHSQVW